MDQEFRDEGHRGRIAIVLGVILAIGRQGGVLPDQSGPAAAGQANAQRVPAVVAIRSSRARSDRGSRYRGSPGPAGPHQRQRRHLDPAQVVGRIPPCRSSGPAHHDEHAGVIGRGRPFPSWDRTRRSARFEMWRCVHDRVDDLAVGGLLKVASRSMWFVRSSGNVSADLPPGRYYAERLHEDHLPGHGDPRPRGSFYVVRAKPADRGGDRAPQATGNATFSLALRPDEDTRLAGATSLGETTNRDHPALRAADPGALPAGTGPLQTPIPTASPVPTACRAPTWASPHHRPRPPRLPRSRRTRRRRPSLADHGASSLRGRTTLMLGAVRRGHRPMPVPYLQSLRRLRRSCRRVVCAFGDPPYATYP
jgi:hypothetical protein